MRRSLFKYAEQSSDQADRVPAIICFEQALFFFAPNVNISPIFGGLCFLEARWLSGSAPDCKQLAGPDSNPVPLPPTATL